MKRDLRACLCHTWDPTIYDDCSDLFWQFWRRKWQPTPVFLPGKFHRQRSLAGCSPWGHKESDMTECIVFWQHCFSPGIFLRCLLGFPGGSDDKASACNAGDPGSIPGLGRSPGEGNGNPLQYSYLGNPMDRGAWRAAVHGVTKSRTWLSEHAHSCILNLTHTSLRSSRTLKLVKL